MNCPSEQYSIRSFCAGIAIALGPGLDLDEVLGRAGHRPADYNEQDEATRDVLGIMHRLPATGQDEVEVYARYRLERWQRRLRGEPTVAAEPNGTVLRVEQPVPCQICGERPRTWTGC